VTFNEEQRLKQLLEEHGRYHDCLLAGCTHDPYGNEIGVDPEAKPQKRPPPSKELKQLYKKLKGKDFPDETSLRAELKAAWKAIHNKDYPTDTEATIF